MSQYKDKKQMREVLDLMEQIDSQLNEQEPEEMEDPEDTDVAGDEGDEGGDRNARRMASIFLGDDADTNVNTLAKIIQNHREGQPVEEMLNNRRYREAVATAFERVLDMVEQNQSIFNQMRRT